MLGVEALADLEFSPGILRGFHLWFRGELSRPRFFGLATRSGNAKARSGPGRVTDFVFVFRSWCHEWLKKCPGESKNYLFQVSMVNSKTPLPLSKNSAIWRWFPFTIIGEISQRSRNHFFKIYLALYPYSEVAAVRPSVHQYFHLLFLSGCVYIYIYIHRICVCGCSLSSFPSIRHSYTRQSFYPSGFVSECLPIELPILIYLFI